MPLSSDVLALSEARLIALNAQGFGDPLPRGRIDRRHLRRVLGRVGLVQIDSVNVVTRAHELAFLARLGPYSRKALGSWLWGSGEVFEYWGHEASLLPVGMHPALRWRMERPEGHAWSGVASVLRTHPGLEREILAAVAGRGPVTLGQLDHLGAAIKRTAPAPGAMWNWTPAKKAVEWLFWRGEVSAIRNPRTFERSYVLPEQVLPEEVLGAPPMAIDDAHKALLMAAARSHGVGSARCLADYHRLDLARSRKLLEELASDGALRRVSVQDWQRPAFLHPDAVLPHRSTAACLKRSALLSPFDSLIWERDRTAALFGFRYRAEIYIPPAKRVHGYYVLPFLHRGSLVARVDLKADRQAGVLRVLGAFDEPHVEGRRDDRVAALQGALEELAGFLGLSGVAVDGRGDLIAALRRVG